MDARARGRPEERERRIFRGGRQTLVADLGDSLTTKSGSVFALCDTDGDIDLSRNPGHGVYFHDVRFLDRATLRLDGRRLSVLLCQAEGDRTICELTNPDIQLREGGVLPKERIGLRRERRLGERVEETIEVHSYAAHELRLQLELEFECGFDDMFTVRGAPPGRRGEERPPRWDGDSLVLEYLGADGRRRSTALTFDPSPDERGPGCASYRLALAPRSRHAVRVRAELRDEGEGSLERTPRKFEARAFEGVEVSSDSDLFNRVLKRSFDDLSMLLMAERRQTFFAAGVPWFVALFGRDSVITALQTLPYDAAIAANTLRLLASYQGDRDDSWRDEQPGKILHELRVGEQANLGQVPQTPYYGTVDATPLFLVLLSEYVDWTGDLELFRGLREPAERALEWIDRYGDSDGDGFVDYETRSGKGFRNQGWKDSGNSIVDSDGSLAEPPIALVEVQGYVYRAKHGMARLLRAAGELEAAKRREQEAEDLRRRFGQRFWSRDQGYLALALQRGGKRAEAVASNAGQALWSGIVDPRHVDGVVERLMGDGLFSGWGIRTLSRDEPAFNPIDYQVGSVWPHDNALIMAGLKRSGRNAEACRVFSALFEAAALFPQYRLPEVFAGFGRDQYPVPVRYPIACSPQAWAAAAIPSMLASALGLEPHALEGRLEIRNPALPEWLTEVTLQGLRVGGARLDLRYHRVGQDTLVAVLRREGSLDVSITY
jgi:glycogen debranching enzyme